MNNIIESIQQDIINPSVSLGTILLKAKVLAHQLKNEQFKQWIKAESDGYSETEIVPDYRMIPAYWVAQMVAGYTTATDIPIGLGKTSDEFKEAARTIKFRPGIAAVEEIAQRQEPVYFPWPPQWLAIWTHANARELGYQQLIGVKCSVAPQMFAQMLQTVRSRLQDFILELSDLPWNMEGRSLPPEQIERLVSVTIYNRNEGGTMSTFDQRGQQVQNQNNAARDVNISGGISIQNNADLVQAVRGLRDLLDEVEQDKRQDVVAAIEVLEVAAQDDSASKGQVVQAVETVSEVPAMRQHLETLAHGVTVISRRRAWLRRSSSRWESDSS